MRGNSALLLLGLDQFVRTAEESDGDVSPATINGTLRATMFLGMSLGFALGRRATPFARAA